MQMLRRTLAVILGLIGLAVLLHFVIGPFYASAVEGFDIWSVLNWFMAFGVIATLIVTFRARRDALANGCETRTYIGVNAGFYAAAALTILFFWNWFGELASDGGSESAVSGNFWVVIDTLFVILMARTGVDLWGGAQGESLTR